LHAFVKAKIAAERMPGIATGKTMRRVGRERAR